MKDTRLIQEITLQNILSFGPENPPLPLHNLNMLIGPNASGKSNLIECINLLRHCATDMRPFIDAGGVTEWAWKGGDQATSRVSAVLSLPGKATQYHHQLDFNADSNIFKLQNETIQTIAGDRTHNTPGIAQCKRLPNYDPAQSMLSQCDAPELATLTGAYDKIAIYREWYFGRYAALRTPQAADLRDDKLKEDFSNLGLFLKRLQAHSQAKQALLDNLQDLYEGVTDFHVTVREDEVQVYFTEGDFTIPSTRLSSGTLRYLCLLAILCDPTPPPLICIDEPELSLHPDVLPKIADLLIEASERTQIIVTSHSDILVDAMTEQPESVVICDKVDGQTVMKRLRREDVAHWLDDYRLGELWTRGELGGTRW